MDGDEDPGVEGETLRTPRPVRDPARPSRSGPPGDDLAHRRGRGENPRSKSPAEGMPVVDPVSGPIRDVGRSTAPAVLSPAPRVSLPGGWTLIERHPFGAV